MLEIVGAVQQRHPLAIVVIACNTASTVSLPALRERFSFPVVGVVPAIKPAARLTVNGIVGLLATRGTVQRSYTHELISRFATDCKIELLGSSELVELAEAAARRSRAAAGAEEDPASVAEHARAAGYRRAGLHPFPLLAEELMQVLPEGTRLVDSGAAIARRTAPAHLDAGKSGLEPGRESGVLHGVK